MIFGALVILLIALGLVFLIYPVLKKPSDEDSLGREQQNISIAKEKKSLLEEQLSEGQMSQSEFDAALIDLESSLAIDLERQQALDNNQHSGKWAVWFFILFVPVLSIYSYYELGEYRVIDNPDLLVSKNQATHNNGTGEAPSMSELIDKLKNHLRDNPEDSRGWFMLGRTLMSLQQYPEAVTAFQRSYDLTKTEPTIMLALADALAMIRDGDMRGEPEKLVKQALELSPDELTGLWLAGLAAEQSGRFREAFDYWVKLLPLLGDDLQSTSEIKTLLAALKKKQPDLPELNFVSAPVAEGLSVAVSLDSKFVSKVNADDLLFIYAKAASGPPMPLAAKRLKVSDLPIQVTLSDNDAVMPQMKISGFDQIIVGARVSKSGNPVGQAGDLFNESKVISLKDQEGIIEINIDQVKQ